MPAIRAIGVTDYYSTETYERVGEAKRNGRLMDCRLIFRTSKCDWESERSRANG
jgi:hypothetical protein